MELKTSDSFAALLLEVDVDAGVGALVTLF